MTQQTMAAENALTGEKHFRTVSYALTGDVELDLICALTAVVNAEAQDTAYQNRFQSAARALEYVCKRYQAMAEALQKQQESFRAVQSAGLGGGGNIVGTLCDPAQYQQPSWLSGISSGSIPPQANIDNQLSVNAFINASQARKS